MNSSFTLEGTTLPEKQSEPIRAVDDSPPKPDIRHAVDQKNCKGEDVSIAEEAAAEGFSWRFFAILDGHQGSECARFVKRKLWPILLRSLPTKYPSSWNGEDGVDFADAIRKAIVKAFEQVDSEWYSEKKLSGTTATVALLANHFLTVANVGDSTAFLHTGSHTVEMSKNHRLTTSKSEQKRLRRENVSIAPLCSSMKGPAMRGEEGFGPLRVWPGGLAVSRSIGDADTTPQVVCYPHIRQILVPASGARLLIASDGLWDTMPLSRILNRVCSKRLHKLPPFLINSVAHVNGGWVTDDTTVLAVDILPSTCRDFKDLGIRRRRRFAPCCVSPLVKDEDSPAPEFYTETDSLYLAGSSIEERTIRVFNTSHPNPPVPLPEHVEYTVHGGHAAGIFEDCGTNSSCDMSCSMRRQPPTECSST